ncbi:MAG: hypothetical protein O7D30_09415, partial [Rickettsia endosymbiont of Ixodes persulcatus]|nr:hypothetical protein [Rickettsia endosymbiont of Ixodes persulcatus]
MVPGLCWSYGKEKAKPILPFDSCHSKHVKAGLVRNMINNAFQKSCWHSIMTSIQVVFSRLNVAKYPLCNAFKSQNDVSRPQLTHLTRKLRHSDLCARQQSIRRRACHDRVIARFSFELRIKAKEEEVKKSFHDPFNMGMRATPDKNIDILQC